MVSNQLEKKLSKILVPLDGSPTSMEAEEKNLDLIVVGTRGHSGIKKLLLGTTASGIVTYSSCQVIMVK